MNKQIFFDVSGLVQWYAYADHATGIQRVMQGVLGSRALAYQANIQFIARAIGSDTFYNVEPHIICGLDDAVKRPGSIASLRRVFAASKRLASPMRLLREMVPGHIPYIAAGWSRMDMLWSATNQDHRSSSLELQIATTPRAGDIIICLGDFWCHRGHADALLRLKNGRDVALIMMIHDLAAIFHPEWTHPYYGREFTNQLDKVAPQVDHWLTNSRYVKSHLGRFLSSRSLPSRPIDVLPMGWPRTTPRWSFVPRNDAPVLQKYGLKTDNYFLHVGTIQPRKNIDSLVDSVVQLRRDVGEQIPACVLVGSDGWRSEAIRRRIKRLEWKDSVRWLTKVDDRELSVLYRHAKFTVIPSHEEGWGLTAQESLAHGTPCIASFGGGLPEAGLDLVRYVDIEKAQALTHAIRSYATNEQIIIAARKYIQSRMQNIQLLPTWEDAAHCIMAICNAQSGPRKPKIGRTAPVSTELRRPAAFG